MTQLISRSLILRSAEKEELAKRTGLEELSINDSDPTETAKKLGALFARRNDFLSNGYVPDSGRGRRR